jgi:hypothetical protein
VTRGDRHPRGVDALRTSVCFIKRYQHLASKRGVLMDGRVKLGHDEKPKQFLAKRENQDILVLKIRMER